MNNHSKTVEHLVQRYITSVYQQVVSAVTSMKAVDKKRTLKEVIVTKTARQTENAILIVTVWEVAATIQEDSVTINMKKSL